MERFGLPEKAKTNQKSSKKRTVEDKNGKNTKMETSNGRTRELRSSIGERRARWENLLAEGSVTRPHAPTLVGQLPEKNTCVTARGSSVTEVLAFDG